MKESSGEYRNYDAIPITLRIPIPSYTCSNMLTENSSLTGEAESPNPINNRASASFYMIMSTTFLILSDSLASYLFLNHNITSMEIVLWRSFILASIHGIQLYFSKDPPLKISPDLLKAYVLLASSVFLGTTFRVMSLNLLQLSQAIPLTLTTPLFITLFTSQFARNERKNYGVFGIILSIVGVFILCEDKLSVKKDSDNDHFLYVAGAIFALLSPMLLSLYRSFINEIDLGSNPAFQNLFTSVFSMLFSIPFLNMRLLRERSSVYTVEVVALLIGLGVCAWICNACLTVSTKKESSGRITTLAFYQVIDAYIMSITVFGYIPSIINIIGTLFIVAGGVALTLYHPLSQNMLY